MKQIVKIPELNCFGVISSSYFYNNIPAYFVQFPQIQPILPEKYDISGYKPSEQVSYYYKEEELVAATPKEIRTLFKYEMATYLHKKTRKE